MAMRSLYVLCTMLLFSFISFAKDDSVYVVERWRHVEFGQSIGRKNIINYDIDKDGIDEIILDSGYPAYSHLRILKYKNSEYATIWTSKVHRFDKDYITDFELIDIGNDGKDELIELLADGTIVEYDLSSLKVKALHPTSAKTADALHISDLNQDGTYEYIIVRDSNYFSQPYLKIINSDTFEEEFSSAELFGKDVKTADMDNDGTYEIVLSTGKVLNGLTREMKWSYAGGFGENIILSNIDQDPAIEIVGLSDYSYITAFDAELKTPSWQIHVEDNLEGMYITDFDDDGIADIIAGNYQWGYITCYRSSDRSVLWKLKNPDTGATNILAADADKDGIKEIMWGAGHTSSGEDNFYVGDPLQNKIEWKSLDLDGMFFVDAEDLNNDNKIEITALSHSSDDNYHNGFILTVDPSSHEITYNKPVKKGYGITSLCVSNLDEKGTGEIIYAGESTFFVTDAVTHNIIYQYTLPSFSYITSIEAEDVDNDKAKEIIIGDQQGYVRIFDGRTFNQKWTSIRTGNSIGRIIIDNIDEDISPEIIFFNRDGNIQVYDGTTHYLEWQSQLMPGISALDIADIDDDGVKEFIAGFKDGSIVVLNSKTYETKNEYKLFNEAIHAIAAANLDSADGLEIITGTSNLSVFEGKDFTKKWESEPLGGSIGYGDNIIVKDIDKDGFNDILAGGGWGIFHFESGSKYHDITPPYLKEHKPLEGQRNTEINTKIEITFSEKIDTSGITENIIIQNGAAGKYAFTVLSDDSMSFTLQPAQLLSAEDTIRVILTNKIKDLSGNYFDGNKNKIQEKDSTDNFVFSFITGSGIDTVPPVFANLVYQNSIWRGIKLSIKGSVSDYSPVSTTGMDFIEYFIDSVGIQGTGMRVLPDDGMIDSVKEDFSIIIPTGDWQHGDHYVYFSASDLRGNVSEPVKIKIHVKYENPSNWTTNGHNVLHTRFNHADSITSDLKLKIKKEFSYYRLGPVAVIDELVVFAATDLSNSRLVCMRSDTGEIVWKKEFEWYIRIGAPGFAYGNIYVQIRSNNGDLYCYDLLTGEEKWHSSFGTGGITYSAPAIHNGVVFINGGINAGICAIDAETGKQLWSGELAQFDNWSPAIYNSTVYAFVEGKLSAFEENTGQALWGKEVDFKWWGWSMNTSPVIDTVSNTILVTSKEYLHAIGINSREVKWEKHGDFDISPALFNKQVFAVNRGTLVVYDAEKGDSLWGFKGSTKFLYSPVISNGFLFVASNDETYALQIDQKKEVWKYPKGGELAVSNNKLFVATDSGYVLIFGKSTTGINAENDIPQSYALLQNYPNPFNPSTHIEYKLPENADVAIQIYNSMGELVETLVNEYQSAGYYKKSWNAGMYASGIYFCRISAGKGKQQYTHSIKMIYLK